MDTDSDGITYISGNSVYHAKGPDLSNLRNMNKSNFSQSTLNMPRNFEKQFGNMDLNYMHKRETSPMSVYRDILEPRNFCTYTRVSNQDVSPNRSLISKRGGTSMSVRSIDSIASVNVVNIVTAIKSAQLDSTALNSIIDSCKFLKKFKKQNRMRQHHLFKKRHRYESDNDSSKGSDSSSSGGDSRCTRKKSKLAGYNRKFSKDIDLSLRSKSTVSNMTETGYLCKKTSINGLEQQLGTDQGNTSKNTNIINKLETQLATAKNQNNVFIFNSITDIRNPQKYQKYRFNDSFLFPCQRFNKNTASNKLEEEKDYLDNQMVTKPQTLKTNIPSNADTDCNESKGNQYHKPLNNMGKRNLCDSNDPLGGDKKRIKLDTKKLLNASETLDEKENDFMFAKPNLPIKKPSKVKEILISKCAQATFDHLSPIKNTKGDVDNMTKHGNTSENGVSDVTQNNTTTEVSMKPSFTKRKLFTQTLDIAETKSLSSDDIHSPQTNFYKEKNKTRRLVSGQSCLLRDVTQDDNTLINLLQTIVPSDQINLTQASNKSVLKTEKANTSKKSKSKCAKDDWDLISSISTCENGNISDTYTDEEIFDNRPTADKETEKSEGKNLLNKYNIKQCVVVLENLPSVGVHRTSKVDLISKIKNQQTKNDVKEKVDKLETNIFNEIVHMEKEANDESILSPATLRKQNGCITNPIATTLQNAGGKSKIDDKVPSNVSSIQRSVNANNKSGAVVKQEKSVAQVVEAFWNTVLDSDAETEGCQDKRVHPIVTENSIERPRKSPSLPKPSNIPQKYSITANSLKRNYAKTALKQISVGKLQVNDKQSNKQAIAPKQRVGKKKNVDESLIENATVGANMTTRRNYYLRLCDNSLDSPNFNLHKGNSGADKISKITDKVVEKRVNNQETISTLQRKDFELNGNNSSALDLNNGTVKQRGKSNCREKSSLQSQEEVKDNGNIKSKEAMTPSKISAGNRGNNSAKFRTKRKKITKPKKQNDFNITIQSLRSNDSSRLNRLNRLNRRTRK